MVSLLVPNRDVGFQAQGDLAGGKLLYSAGIFNGNPADGTSAITDVDTNNSKDLAGRIVVLPFRSTTTPPTALSNFGFHLGGSTGNQTGALPSYRTSAGQTYFSFPTTTTADGRRNRVTPAVFLYLKSFGGFAEYARTTQEIVTSGVPRTVTNQAWGVTASYVLTGEATSERGVRPKAPFDPVAGAWGALQVAARYAELTLDSDLFTGGVAAANASRKAQQMTLAANWFLNNYVKIYATYERFDVLRPACQREPDPVPVAAGVLAFILSLDTKSSGTTEGAASDDGDDYEDPLSNSNRRTGRDRPRARSHRDERGSARAGRTDHHPQRLVRPDARALSRVQRRVREVLEEQDRPDGDHQGLARRLRQPGARGHRRAGSRRRHTGAGVRHRRHRQRRPDR